MEREQEVRRTDQPELQRFGADINDPRLLELYLPYRNTYDRMGRGALPVAVILHIAVEYAAATAPKGQPPPEPSKNGAPKKAPPKQKVAAVGG